ncbi:dienelactone hydrolase family protein [Chromobacterium haemolyticum]|nr:dienelactone hydrolase family protein [Chromobacterium haemolyticum]
MTSNRYIDASRRDFLNSAVGVGFALAVQPIAASAILTDGDGLNAGAVEIPTGPAIMPGYMAKPFTAGGPLPVVLVVQEIFGVHEHIRDLCRRLAKSGYWPWPPSSISDRATPARWPASASWSAAWSARCRTTR